MSSAEIAGLGERAPRALLPLIRAIADLKRVRSAGRTGSIAERLFAKAWGGIAAGREVREVARATVTHALAATILGDLDPQMLIAAGVPAQAAREIWVGAAAEAAAPTDPAVWRWAGGAAPLGEASTPAFVDRLASQPRAGATCAGLGRLILEPAENHAEHCAVVAICGAMLAPAWGACSETVFLAGLAHHLHNALLPDSGYVGEIRLGEWLAPAMANATALALRELSANVRDRVEEARRILPDAATAEGRTFHAADTLDRVLQVEHHLRAAGTTMDFVLRRMELVHVGPVKPFQDAVLHAMGLAA